MNLTDEDIYKRLNRFSEINRLFKEVYSDKINQLFSDALVFGSSSLTILEADASSRSDKSSLDLTSPDSPDLGKVRAPKKKGKKSCQK